MPFSRWAGVSQLPYDLMVYYEVFMMSGHVALCSQCNYCTLLRLCTHIATTLHLFNGLFSRTAWVSRHQKGNRKPFWILLEQEMMGWQWHQQMQIICTSLQTDNHASTSPLEFYTRRNKNVAVEINIGKEACSSITDTVIMYVAWLQGARLISWHLVYFTCPVPTITLCLHNTVCSVKCGKKVVSVWSSSNSELVVPTTRRITDGHSPPPQLIYRSHDLSLKLL